MKNQRDDWRSPDVFAVDGERFLIRCGLGAFIVMVLTVILAASGFFH